MKDRIRQILFNPTQDDMTNIMIVTLGLGLIMLGLQMLMVSP